MMKNSVFLSKVPISLLTLPYAFFSKIIYNNTYTNTYLKLYVNRQYKQAIFYCNNSSIKEFTVSTQRSLIFRKNSNTHDIFHTSKANTISISQEENFKFFYAPELQITPNNFNSYINYELNNTGLEIEGIYEKFYVRNSGTYELKDKHKYFTLVHAINTSSKILSHNLLRNNGMSIRSIMINKCHTLFLNNIKILLYICAGVSQNSIHFFDVFYTKIAYQVKICISYMVAHKAILFTNGYYNNIIGYKLKIQDSITYQNL